MIDEKNNIWVWCVSGKIKWPHAILGSADYIYGLVRDNPSEIFFFGPSELADVNWNER